MPTCWRGWRAQGPVEVELALGARMLPDAPSANVVGELRGRERPDEIVLLGAHIDSWDVGQGASDDGAGCVAVMEAVRLLRAVRSHTAANDSCGALHQRGVRPRRRGGLSPGARRGASRRRVRDRISAWPRRMRIGVGSEDIVRTMAPLLPEFQRFGIRAFVPMPSGPT